MRICYWRNFSIWSSHLPNSGCRLEIDVLVGAIPLLAVPFLYKYLPESLGFLMAQNNKKRIGQLVAKIDPSYTPRDGDEYEINVPPKKGYLSKSYLKMDERSVPYCSGSIFSYAC